MNKLKSFLFKSDFTKNVTILLSGNGLSLIIPLLLAPLLTRIYTPNDFAGFELFVKIAMLIGVVSALRFEIAILLSEKQSEADSLFRLCIKILLITTGITAVVIWPFRQSIGAALDNTDIAHLLWYLPLIVFFIGGQKILTQYVIRLRQFKSVAASKISSSVINNGAKFALGLSLPSALSLVWGQILGHVVVNISFLQNLKVRHAIRRAYAQKYSTRKLFKKYREFPIINSSHAFFDEGQKALLLFLISAYYGEYILGLFAFSWRYLKVPLQVFGVSLSQVLNEKWARDLDKGILLKAAFRRTILGLLLVAIVPFSVLFFFGKPIFEFIFGQDWATAGVYASYMAPWLLVHFTVSPVSFLPVLFHRQKTNFTIAVIGNVIILSTVVLMSIFTFAFKDVLLAIVVLNTCLMLVVLTWYYALTLKPRPPLI